MEVALVTVCEMESEIRVSGENLRMRRGLA